MVCPAPWHIALVLLRCTMIFLLLYSDTAMDTDEGEKEVPAKKAKTDPVLVITVIINDFTSP